MGNNDATQEVWRRTAANRSLLEYSIALYYPVCHHFLWVCGLWLLAQSFPGLSLIDPVMKYEELLDVELSTMDLFGWCCFHLWSFDQHVTTTLLLFMPWTATVIRAIYLAATVVMVMPWVCLQIHSLFCHSVYVWNSPYILKLFAKSHWSVFVRGYHLRPHRKRRYIMYNWYLLNFILSHLFQYCMSLCV